MMGSAGAGVILRSGSSRASAKARAETQRRVVRRRWRCSCMVASSRAAFRLAFCVPLIGRGRLAIRPCPVHNRATEDRLHSRLGRLAFVLGIVAFATSGNALAQDFPARPIRLVVGFTAGGTTD